MGPHPQFEHLSVLSRGWEYRGEGNANIVIALKDDPLQRVLRLAKVDHRNHRDHRDHTPSEQVLEGDHAPWEEEEDEGGRRRVEREVGFARSVWVGLLGLEAVGHTHPVLVPPGELGVLDARLLPLRPSHRLHKGLRAPFATAHTDLATLPPLPPQGTTPTHYCVEIKAKQGWWPNHLTPTTRCTYCLNQFHKVLDTCTPPKTHPLSLKLFSCVLCGFYLVFQEGVGKIGVRSGYCPLDLFSGEAPRMVAAVRALLSNPQNNLRLFKNGAKVWGDTNGGRGDEVALQSILAEWFQEGPHPPQGEENLVNNLVFLVTTALLRTESEEGLGLYEELRTALETALSGGPHPPPPKGEGMGECRPSARPLPQHSILQRVLAAQRLGDVPVDRIYAHFRRICPLHASSNHNHTPPMAEVVVEGEGLFRGCGSERGSSETSGISSLSSEDEEEEEETVREELGEESPEEHPAVGPLCPGPLCLQATKEVWFEEEEGLVGLGEEEGKELEAYLIAAVAKDSSLMVTFSPLRYLTNHTHSLTINMA